FSYLVAPGDSTSDLRVTALNLPVGTTIQDADGNDLAGLVRADLGFQIDAIPPSALSITAKSNTSGAFLGTGSIVTLTLTLTEQVSVLGTPILQLNNGEIARYLSGSGSNSLTFSYTVKSGDDISDLQVVGLTLPPGAAVQDEAGNSLAGIVTG